MNKIIIDTHYCSREEFQELKDYLTEKTWDWQEISSGETEEETFKSLWERFGDVPVNDDGEILESFEHFPEGTDREDVWSWFEEKYNVTLGDLM